MSNGSVLQALKEVIYCLYDSNGNKRVRPIGRIGKLKLHSDRLKALYSISELVLRYDTIDEITKFYIKDRSSSIRQVFEFYEEIEPDKYTYNAIANKIMYDKRKLDTAFGNDMIFNIINTSKTIEVYIDRIESFKAKVAGSNKERCKLRLEIEEDYITTSYNGEFIEDYFEILSIYSDARMKVIEQVLNQDRKFKGYFNYLMSASNIDDEKAKEDRKKLIKLLNGKYNISDDIILPDECGDSIENDELASIEDDEEIII